MLCVRSCHYPVNTGGLHNHRGWCLRTPSLVGSWAGGRAPWGCDHYGADQAQQCVVGTRLSRFTDVRGRYKKAVSYYDTWLTEHKSDLNILENYPPGGEGKTCAVLLQVVIVKVSAVSAGVTSCNEYIQMKYIWKVTSDSKLLCTTPQGCCKEKCFPDWILSKRGQKNTDIAPSKHPFTACTPSFRTLSWLIARMLSGHKLQSYIR